MTNMPKRQMGERIAETNNYGDFEFEGVKTDKDYSIKIEYPGYVPKEFGVQTKTDVYMGEIVLNPDTKS